ncbi:NYN domain-containing protein [Candidatus Daviesbacteria bacterium]|nr:NYN domain-containing protein [Candidatus Daviesbacteria bacterium]
MKTYAFIDSQNLNLGVQSLGWKLDWRKFRQYLRNKYNVSEAYTFIGYKAGNEALYTKMQQMGYIVVLKPTMELPDKTVKGNVDAELVLHSMIHYKEYNKSIIVSGDGDFHCLVEYLDQQEKLLHILAPNRHYSGLLRKYNRYIIRVDLLRNSLEAQKKTEINGRSKP